MKYRFSISLVFDARDDIEAREKVLSFCRNPNLSWEIKLQTLFPGKPPEGMKLLSEKEIIDRLFND